MSNDEEGVKMVRMAASQIETLCPQVRGILFSRSCTVKSKKEQRNSATWNFKKIDTLSVDIRRLYVGYKVCYCVVQ